MLAACASTQTLALRPAELRLATTELRSDRSAIVTSLDGDVGEIHPKDRVDLVDRQGHHYTMLVDELVAHCAGSDAELCGYRDIERVTVEVQPESGEPANHAKLYRDGLWLAGVGLVTCSLACPSPYNYVSVGVIGAAAVGAVGLFFYLLASWRGH